MRNELVVISTRAVWTLIGLLVLSAAHAPTDCTGRKVLNWDGDWVGGGCSTRSYASGGPSDCKKWVERHCKKGLDLSDCRYKKCKWTGGMCKAVEACSNTYSWAGDKL